MVLEEGWREKKEGRVSERQRNCCVRQALGIGRNAHLLASGGMPIGVIEYKRSRSFA